MAGVSEDNTEEKIRLIWSGAPKDKVEEYVSLKGIIIKASFHFFLSAELLDAEITTFTAVTAKISELQLWCK